MKKKLFIMAAFVAVFASSCKKSIDDPEVVPPVKLAYSNLSVEEHKKALDKSGTDFLATVNTLPDENFIKVIKHFIEIDGDVPTYTLPFSSLFSIYSSAQSGNLYGIFNSTITPNAKKLSEYYAVYTWDFVQKKWNKTASDSKLEIKFPSSKTATTNNAVLSFTSTLSGITSTIDGQKYELPASTTATLVVDNKEEMKLTTNQTYKTDGNPTAIDVKLMMGSFNFNVNVKSDVKKVNATLSFAKGTTSLLNLTSEGNGNADINTVIKATELKGILDNANASFEIMNIKLVGVIDSKSISNEGASNNNLSEAEKNKKKADLYNKYTSVYAVYKNENAIIAKVTFAPVEDVHSYEYWDGTKMVKYSYTNYSMEPRLVFKDDSKLSLKAFTETGFSKLTTAFEDYIDRF
ncbi:hypothetical protein [Pedobacter nototheniae]|uniref:hypothetical protein n=1 Tax=Pedobacter nototheniae TaxID=2488994 RepID=UPI00103E8805|nr:hypothetical protein [Pedobacter nototheniae]